MPETDWVLLFNLLIEAGIGFLFGGLLGTGISYFVNRRRDDLAWERKLVELEKQREHNADTTIQNRWRELKLDAYMKVIEALIKTTESLAAELDAEMGERQLTPEQKKG